MNSEISLFDGTAWYVVFLFSTTVHEASHAFAALKLGDDTAHRGGQVTLDPFPHIKREPIGMLVAPILSYLLGGWMIGWASAPYDPHWANRYPKRAALMAVAGPLSNLALMLLAGVLIRAGMLFGQFVPPEHTGFDIVVEATKEGIPHLCAIMLSITFSQNLLLFLFNLLPLPPLDGSSVPLLFLSEEKAEGYSNILQNPTLNMFGLMIAWKLSAGLFSHAHLFAVNLLYPELHYVDKFAAALVVLLGA